MKHWIIVMIAIGLLALHEKLSTTKYWLLGGLLPLAGVGAAVYQFCILKMTLPAEGIVAYIVFFAVTLLLWMVGRYEHRQKELNRMKARDIQAGKRP